MKDMNEMMLEIWKDYLKLCCIFTNKLDTIRADEELNVNLELLRASIMDLSINLSNFKDNLSSTNTSNSDTTTNATNATNATISVNNSSYNLEEDNLIQDESVLSGDLKKKMLALFFMFLMKIDKESILNGKPSNPDKVSSLEHPDYPDLD